MELIIAVFLGLIILGKVGMDKNAIKKVDSAIQKSERAKDDWSLAHTNKQMEDEFYKMVKQESCYDGICDEIAQVFESLPHWRGRRVSLFRHQLLERNHRKAEDQLINNRNLVVDILLAKKGFVSTSAATFGYYAYVGSELLEPMAYEMVLWIQRAVCDKKGNIEFTLDEKNNKYVWVGSRAASWCEK